jgi:hypothetical protein
VHIDRKRSKAWRLECWKAKKPESLQQPISQPGQAGTNQVEITILLLINSLGSPANA